MNEMPWYMKPFEEMIKNMDNSVKVLPKDGEEMKDSCANCKHNRPIEHWEYDKVKTGEWKHKLNGYACTVFDEAVVWMTGCDVEKGMCELWTGGEQE